MFRAIRVRAVGTDDVHGFSATGKISTPEKFRIQIFTPLDFPSSHDKLVVRGARSRVLRAWQLRDQPQQARNTHRKTIIFTGVDMTFHRLGSIDKIERYIVLRWRLAALAMTFVFTAAFMTGCGGGGSGGSSTASIPVTVAGYFYNVSAPVTPPCCNLTLQDGSMAVAVDGTTYLVLENGVLFVGRLTFTASTFTPGLKQVTGSGVAYAPILYGGVPVASMWNPPISGVQVTGTMSGTAFIATMTIPGIGNYSASAVYNPASNTPVTLAGLAGNYTAGTVHLTIDGNGVITGSDGSCPSYNGNAALSNASYDVFSITLTCTPSSGTPYTLTGLSARGTNSGAAGATDLLLLMLADPNSSKNVYFRLVKQ